MSTIATDAPFTMSLRPAVRIGAASPGRLALPDATPTRAQVYAPRGVWLDDERLIVVDSGNHRVLIWHGVPDTDGAQADAVLGQPDFFCEGVKLLHLPTGVLVAEGKLFIADAWHHRVLVWNRVPETSGVAPDYAIGQGDLTGVAVNRDGAVGADTLYWPYGIAWIAGRFWVADTGNRRVLGWRGLPQPNQPADIVLGQPDAAHNDENRGAAPAAASFRWPHGFAGDANVLWVADAGNHRVLGWRGTPDGDRPADFVLGQPDFTTAREWPYAKQGPAALRFPYAAASNSVGGQGGRLAIADTANNRILLWDMARACGTGQAASGVLGQPDFGANGENRWKSVENDTLCWPYGLCWHKNRLAIADSGNNRVMVWEEL